MGMQRLPRKGGECDLGSWRQKRRFGAESAAVNFVAQERVPDRSQMHPDLMGPAGFQSAKQERGYRCFGALAFAGLPHWPKIPFQHLPMRDSRAAALTHRHLLAGFRMPVDRLIDHSMQPLGRAPDEGEVGTLERLTALTVIGELRGERLMGAVVLE